MTNAESRISRFDHLGVSVLFMDFRRASSAESIAMIDDYLSVIKRDAKPLYLFVDVTGTEYDASVAAKWKAVQLEQSARTSASAIIGLEGLVGLAVRAFMQLSEFIAPEKLGGPKRIFTTRDEALAWLVKQSKTK